MDTTYEALFDLYAKLHRKGLPLLATVIAASEIRGPWDEMVEAFVMEAITR